MRFSNKYLSVLAIVSLAFVSGCDRRTPEERLATAVQFYQQQDMASAEMEALKVVEKAPGETAGVQASMLLAQIFAQQNRMEEAEEQVQSALDHVSQLEPAGKEVLKVYLTLLNQQKKYKKALEVVEKYQKEYADDPGTSLSLRMAGVDIRTQSGDTTAARTILQDQIDQTTSPAELNIYRQLYFNTYQRDQDTSSAIQYMEGELAKAEDINTKTSLMLALSNLYGAVEDYETARKYLQDATGNFMVMVKDEVDRRTKMGMSLDLARAYMELGNLPGARRVFQAVYDTNIKDPQILTPTVLGLAEILLRSGETSATVSLFEDAHKKHPEAHFDQQLKGLLDLQAKGELQHMAPVDTSTLTMKFRNDSNILWPAELPGLLGNAMPGSKSGADETSGTVQAEPETTATQVLESVSDVNQDLETTTTADSPVTTTVQ